MSTNTFVSHVPQTKNLPVVRSGPPGSSALAGGSLNSQFIGNLLNSLRRSRLNLRHLLGLSALLGNHSL